MKNPLFFQETKVLGNLESPPVERECCGAYEPKEESACGAG